MRICGICRINNDRDGTLFLLLVFSLSWAYSWLPFAAAQQLPTQADLCPDYEEVDPLEECESVTSYVELKALIEQSASEETVNVCPFFVQKISTLDPIIVRKGVKVRCARKTPNDICAISGMGQHVWIDTSEHTLWQGLSFRGSDDHTVYVVGEVENAASASHTFCQSSFIDNVRTKDTRGGAFMTEKESGTVNIVQCLFSENFSENFGGGIYSRTNQLNIINSVFIKNRSNGYGPAVFTASGASLMIRDTLFLGNRGRDDYSVVYNPGKP